MDYKNVDNLWITCCENAELWCVEGGNMSVFDRSPQITSHLLMNQALPHGAQVRSRAASCQIGAAIKPSALTATVQPSPCTRLAPHLMPHQTDPHGLCGIHAISLYMYLHTLPRPTYEKEKVRCK